MKTLYEVTNNILDVNTILVNRNEYNELLKDTARLNWVMPILTEQIIYPNDPSRQLIDGKTGREAIDGAMEL